MLCLGSCQGAIGAGEPVATDPATGLPVGGADAHAGNAGSSSNSGAADGGNKCQQLELSSRAVLVTPRAYVNVLRDLVGAKAVTDEDATASSDLSFDTVDRPRMTTATLDRFVHLADHAVTSLKPGTAAFFGCSTLMDTACVRTALNRVAHRAWKRPLDASELDALMALRDMGVANVSTDQGETGALAALEAVLVSPSTMYRTEFGQNPQQPMLTAHERAAALAAFLLDSVPDDALLAAADDGSLMTDTGLANQVDRLLQMQRVRDHLTQLVLTAYNVPRVFSTAKDASVFPEYTAELQTSMYEQTRRFVSDVLWTRNAPLGELLTSRHNFVDGALAKLYGVAAPQDPKQFTAVDLPPERSGLLTQASVLTVLSRTDKTSVVARGLYMRGNVLCLPKIPGPPEAVRAQVAAQLSENASQGELAAYRAMTSPCMNCHSQFDRFGLLFEDFDPIGRYKPAQSQPIDFTGLPPLDGTIADVAAFTAGLQQTHRFEQCFADRTLGYALTLDSEGDRLCLPGFDDPAQLQAATLRDLVLAVAQSSALNVRTQEP